MRDWADDLDSRNLLQLADLLHGEIGLISHHPLGGQAGGDDDGMRIDDVGDAEPHDQLRKQDAAAKLLTAAENVELRRVECVQRLAVFEHDVICDISNVIDRSFTKRFETFRKPFGRWANFYVFNYPSSEAVTKIRSFDGHEIGRDAFWFAREICDLCLAISDNGQFSRYTKMR